MAVIALFAIRSALSVRFPQTPLDEGEVAISGDGRVLAYSVARANKSIRDIRIFWADDNRKRTLTEGGNGSSRQPRLDRAGATLVFSSMASNLVPQDDNGVSDVFLFDTIRDILVKVPSVRLDPGKGAAFAPAISPGGGTVAFQNVGVFGDSRRAYCLYEKGIGTMRVIGDVGNGIGPASFSPDGRLLAFSAFDGVYTPADIFVGAAVWGGQVESGLLRPGQAASAGQLGTVSGSLDLGTPDGGCWEPCVTERGIFFTGRGDLVDHGKKPLHQIYLRELKNRVRPVCVTAKGNGSSFEPNASKDGRWLAFTSSSSNLVKGDLNGKLDVFLHSLDTNTTICVSCENGQFADHDSYKPAISEDGNRVAFISRSSASAGLQTSDVMLWERGRGLRRLP